MDRTARLPAFGLVLGLLAGLGAGPLAGCGGPGSSASGPTTAGSGDSSAPSGAATTSRPPRPNTAELYRRVKAASLGAKSGRVTGQVATAGKASTFDLIGDLAGRNQRLRINQPGTGSFELLTVAGKQYLKADAAFWKAQGAKGAAGVFANKYLILPAARAKQLSDLTLGGLLRRLFADREVGVLENLSTVVEDATVAGRPAYAIRDRADTGAAILVSADGAARLLRITTHAADPGVTFSAWDAAPTFTVPRPAQIATSPGG